MNRLLTGKIRQNRFYLWVINTLPWQLFNRACLRDRIRTNVSVTLTKLFQYAR